jgi:hypothetical protein
VSGLDHLEGETVNVLADGSAHPQVVVSSGAVALSRAASKVVIGLPAPAYLKIMPLETGSQLGTSVGSVFRIAKVTLRLIDSLGGRVGPSEDVGDVLSYRVNRDAMDAAPPIFTGDMSLGFPGDGTGRASVAITCEQDFPFTVATMAIDVTADGG